MAFIPLPHPNTRPMKARVWSPTAALLEAVAEPHDPEGCAFVAGWLARVGDGRIETDAGMTDEAREAILANERVMFGRQRTILD